MKSLAKRIERATCSNSIFNEEETADREKIYDRAQELIDTERLSHLEAHRQSKEEFIEHVLRENTILLQ